MRKIVFVRFATSILAMSLGACSSVSNKAPQQAPFKIVTGTTTQQEVIAHFGNPDCTTNKNDGTKIYGYMFARPGPGMAFVTVQRYVPGMGLLGGSGTLTAEYLTMNVEYNAAGIVINQSSKSSISISRPDC